MLCNGTKLENHTLTLSTAPVAMAMRTLSPHMMMDWGSTCAG